MPTYDINQETQKNVEEENSSNEVTNNVTEPENKSMIVLSGPLSEVYTKALNMIYGNDNNLSEETQSNDHVIISKNEIDENEPEHLDSDLYIYVTDSEKIEQEKVSKTFDDLRLALDTNKKTFVVIENINNKIGRNQSIIVNYLNNRCAIFHSRKRGLEAIQDVVNK